MAQAWRRFVPKHGKSSLQPLRRCSPPIPSPREEAGSWQGKQKSGGWVCGSTSSSQICSGLAWLRFRARSGYHCNSWNLGTCKLQCLAWIEWRLSGVEEFHEVRQEAAEGLMHRLRGEHTHLWYAKLPKEQQETHRQVREV